MYLDCITFYTWKFESYNVIKSQVLMCIWTIPYMLFVLISNSFVSSHSNLVVFETQKKLMLSFFFFFGFLNTKVAGMNLLFPFHLTNVLRLYNHLHIES